MSYLPRLSKTYKEPQESFYAELEECVSLNTVKPASSLLNEKTFNPQMILRHYRYFPHAPPVLPGPSVLEELREHELYREANRMRRSLCKMEKLSKESENISEQPVVEESDGGLVENESDTKIDEKSDISQGKKSSKGKGKKKSGKLSKKSSHASKGSVSSIMKQPSGISSDWKTGRTYGEELFIGSEQYNREKSPGGYKSDQDERLENLKCGELSNRGIQCTIFGSFAKAFVIPNNINSLLRILSFLLREMNREDTLSTISLEKKSLITQVQLILGDLCNQKIEKEYLFDVTYSDFKRLEKIMGELQKYMKDVYGDKGEYIDKMEDLKKIFIQLKKKEFELAFLTEKLQDAEEKNVQEIVLKESDLKNCEITLQNKRLEREQLTAEAEFSCRELRECQKTIAEVEWDIRDLQEQIMNLKKSAASRSKSAILARKSSVLKFSSDLTARVSRSKESQNAYKKKT